MKKITCLLLALILTLTTLSACSKGNTQTDTTKETTTAADTTAEPETSTERTTETPTEETTEQPNNSDEMRAIQFLECLKDKNISKIVELIGAVDYYKTNKAKVEKAYSFLRSVNIKSYKYDPHARACNVILNITESGSTLFPVGISRWTLEVDQYNYVISMFKRANDSIIEIEMNQKSDTINFCYLFSTFFNSYSTLNNFNKMVPDVTDKTAYSVFCSNINCLLGFFRNESDVKISVLEEYSRKTLGITNIDFRKSYGYDKKKDTFLSGGTELSTPYCTLQSFAFNENKKIYTVILDYYSDSVYILKARTVKYTLKENGDDSFALLSTALLYDSGVTVAYRST